MEDNLIFADLKSDGLFRIVDQLIDKVQGLGWDDRFGAFFRQFAGRDQITVRLRESPAVGADKNNLLSLGDDEDAVECISRAFLCRGEQSLGNEMFEMSAGDFKIRLAFKIGDGRKFADRLRVNLEMRILPLD